jgi:glycosyltransferase involved in cell wall biosynthesis
MLEGEQLKILLVHPGASVSTADVEEGLRAGLEGLGVKVYRYRLDHRLAFEKAAARGWAAYQRRRGLPAEDPTDQGIVYEAGVRALEMALRLNVHVVVIVAGLLVHPDVLALMRRAGLLVTVLLTETPYSPVGERRLAGLSEGVWTNERTAVERLREVCPNVGYLPHAWHPGRHRPEPELAPEYDVAFVGTAWADRIELLGAVNWTGIKLALFGNWEALPGRHRLRKHLAGRQMANEEALGVYRRARINLNLHRGREGWPGDGQVGAEVYAESLNPRAYELAALGVFWISDRRRAEHAEIFGEAVPTFGDALELEALIRGYLADPGARAELADRGPRLVARHSWRERARLVRNDLESLVHAARAQGRIIAEKRRV